MQIYHSFCCKYYKKCYTDNAIIDTLLNNVKCRSKINYQLIILDECQDMTPIYYEYIYKIIKDNYRLAKICILGDRYQSIYDFNK